MINNIVINLKNVNTFIDEENNNFYRCIIHIPTILMKIIRVELIIILRYNNFFQFDFIVMSNIIEIFISINYKPPKL